MTAIKIEQTVSKEKVINFKGLQAAQEIDYSIFNIKPLKVNELGEWVCIGYEYKVELRITENTEKGKFSLSIEGEYIGDVYFNQVEEILYDTVRPCLAS